MVTWIISLLAAAASAYSVYTPSYPRMEALFGPVECAAITGNGALTAGVNAQGRLTVLRWPSPGRRNQIAYRTDPLKGGRHAAPDHHGAMWGVQVDGRILWTTSDEWKTSQSDDQDEAPVITTTLQHPSGLTATLTHFVDAKRNILATQMNVEGADENALFYWYMNLDPSTRSAPELPLADWAWDELNDFALFADDDGQTFVHFRPSDPGVADWQHAQQLVYRQAPALEWRTFGAGTWAAIHALNPVRAYSCGYGREPFSLWSRASAGQLDGATSMMGACALAIAVKPDAIAERLSASILVSLDDSYQDCTDILNEARSTRLAGLLNETRDFWSRWSQTVALPEDDPATRSIALAHLRTLYLCRERDTGSVIRAPYAQPPLAMDWPRTGVWQTLALDLAGLHTEAEMRCLVYAAAIRTTDARGKPLGTVPAAIYGDGTDALPHFILDTAAVGRVLWSFWQHALSVPPDNRASFLNLVWEPTDLAASFLAGWADPLDGVPLYSYDEAVLRERRTFGFLVSVYEGMKAATAIANALGHDRPDWVQRVAELENLIRYESFDAQGRWKHNEGYLLATTGLLEPADPRWGDALTRAFRSSPAPLTAEAILDRLVRFAWLWQGNTERLTEISYVMPMNPRQLLDDRPPDGLHSAMAYLAMRLGYDPNLPN